MATVYFQLVFFPNRVTSALFDVSTGKITPELRQDRDREHPGWGFTFELYPVIFWGMRAAAFSTSVGGGNGAKSIVGVLGSARSSCSRWLCRGASIG